MAKYIDAEAAIYRLHKLAGVDNQPRAIRRAAKYIEKFAQESAADVQEVQHGKWEEDFLINEGVYRCTVCDEKFVTLEGSPDDNRFFYCPFCGAKMDGGETNEG